MITIDKMAENYDYMVNDLLIKNKYEYQSIIENRVKIKGLAYSNYTIDDYIFGDGGIRNSKSQNECFSLAYNELIKEIKEKPKKINSYIKKINNFIKNNPRVTKLTDLDISDENVYAFVFNYFIENLIIFDNIPEDSKYRILYLNCLYNKSISNSALISHYFNYDEEYWNYLSNKYNGFNTGEIYKLEIPNIEEFIIKLLDFICNNEINNNKDIKYIDLGMVDNDFKVAYVLEKYHPKNLLVLEDLRLYLKNNRDNLYNLDTILKYLKINSSNITFDSFYTRDNFNNFLFFSKSMLNIINTKDDIYNDIDDNYEEIYSVKKMTKTHLERTYYNLSFSYNGINYDNRYIETIDENTIKNIMKAYYIYIINPYYNYLNEIKKILNSELKELYFVKPIKLIEIFNFNKLSMMINDKNSTISNENKIYNELFDIIKNEYINNIDIMKKYLNNLLYGLNRSALMDTSYKNNGIVKPLYGPAISGNSFSRKIEVNNDIKLKVTTIIINFLRNEIKNGVDICKVYGISKLNLSFICIQV